MAAAKAYMHIISHTCSQMGLRMIMCESNIHNPHCMYTLCYKGRSDNHLVRLDGKGILFMKGSEFLPGYQLLSILVLSKGLKVMEVSSGRKIWIFNYSVWDLHLHHLSNEMHTLIPYAHTVCTIISQVEV